MAAPDPDTQSLIRRLTAATAQGKLAWEAHTSSAFRIYTDSAQLEIEALDEDGQHPYSFAVKSPQGNFTLGEGVTVEGEGYAKWEQDIGQLYAAARNSALGIKRTYDSLAGSLSLPPDPEDDDIPF